MLGGKGCCFLGIRVCFILFVSLMSFSSKALSISIDVDGKSDRYIVTVEKGVNFIFQKEFFYEPEVLASFKLSNEIVHVLQEVPQGNACDGGDIYIIWLEIDDKVQDKYRNVMRKIDYCGGHTPDISMKGEYVGVYFPPLKSSRWNEENPVFVPGETWLFKPDWSMK